MKCARCGAETRTVEFVYSDGLCGIREVAEVEVCPECGHVHAPGVSYAPDGWQDVVGGAPGEAPVTHRSVVVLKDPTGLFSPGAEFTMLDLLFTYLEGAWSPGMRFRVGGHEAVMLDNVLVRDDGAIFDAHSGAGRYSWRERE